MQHAFDSRMATQLMQHPVQGFAGMDDQRQTMILRQHDLVAKQGFLRLLVGVRIEEIEPALADGHRLVLLEPPIQRIQIRVTMALHEPGMQAVGRMYLRMAFGKILDARPAFAGGRRHDKGIDPRGPRP